MKSQLFTLTILACVSVSACASAPAGKAYAEPILAARSETKYLAFQIFTWGQNPEIAGFALQGTTLPAKSALLPYIKDIKTRIGTTGNAQTRLAVALGPLGCFDQSDADISRFIKLGFNLALETNVAVCFKLDDSMFWAKRKDLWSNPKNVEAMDWKGTPSTGRRLDWGKTPTQAPPQMCFNSPIIEREVRHRALLLGKVIAAGVKRLEQLHKPELFAGVIAGSETMIGQDYKTGRYLGYRALMNRGFSSQHPPKDMDFELDRVVQRFINLWTTGLAQGGVSPEKIYSHTAFLSHKVFDAGKPNRLSYSKFNHFAPPSVAFGKFHRPGFSTYPQPGLFDDIYQQNALHHQVGWASCEGTNLQLGSGPGQSGMNMETYLAKMFNHGATLVDIFSWGVGGESNRNMDFRVVTEGEEAIAAYRKFLGGEPLAEAKSEDQTLMERLPEKVKRIQAELPAWVQRTGNQAGIEPLVQAMDGDLKAKNFEKAEKAADSILEIIDVKTEVVSGIDSQDLPEDVKLKIRHEIGNSFIVYRDTVQDELKLSDAQKTKLNDHLLAVAPKSMGLFDRVAALPPDQRQKEFESGRNAALDELETVLQAVLTPEQHKRLDELVCQREGLFGGPAMWKGLNITPEQQAQFMGVIKPMQVKMEAAVAEAQKGGDVSAVQKKVLALRNDLEGQLEALLTPEQAKIWKEKTGKPMPVEALFDLTP